MLIGLLITSAFAQTQIAEHPRTKTFISIQLSKVCILSPDVCPTYKELADIFDNSNRYLSGDFYINNETGFWDRENPLYPKTFEIYKAGFFDLVIFVNPDSYTAERTKLIVIESRLPIFFDRADKITENNTRILHHFRNIDGCSSAQIGWNNPDSMGLLTDTINYFLKQCKSELLYDTTEYVYKPPTVFTDCHSWCKHLEFLANATHQSKSFQINLDKELR